MISKAPERLTAFHDKAIARDIPADDVERWLATARPCVTLTLHGDGPVAGRLGGPLLLPADAPDPAYPLIASIDLAALPTGATDLPLPADGHLLLFAYPDEDFDDSDDNLGSVVHVPAGATVVERDKPVGLEYDPYSETTRHVPEGPLMAVADLSLPHHHLACFPEEPRIRHLPGHPRAEELVAAWDATRRDAGIWGSLQIGGYSNQAAVDTDPVTDAVSAALGAVEAGRSDWPVSDDVSDWVLIADWHLDITGLEGASVHWSIQREDLAARRFDRAITTMYWNP